MKYRVTVYETSPKCCPYAAENGCYAPTERLASTNTFNSREVAVRFAEKHNRGNFHAELRNW